MESRAKVMGHPVHPMLVVFPLGLFMTSLAFDMLYLWNDNPAFATVSFWNIAFGIAGGLTAAVFGAIDWAAIPSATRAKRLGLLHGAGNVVVVGLFAASWWLRYTAPDGLPPVPAIAVSGCAVAIMFVTGWLGGELVDRLGVGIDDGANLNAPSSLATDPVQLGTSRPL
jgi:uncharacterized membrane protein